MSAADPAYLSDHRVYETVVFPGTGFLEMAAAASRELKPEGNVLIEDVSFHRPIRLPDDERRIVQLVLTRDGARHRCEMFSRTMPDSDDRMSPEWTLHAVGYIAAESADADPPSLDLEAARGAAARRCRLRACTSGFSASASSTARVFGA